MLLSDIERVKLLYLKEICATWHMGNVRVLSFVSCPEEIVAQLRNFPFKEVPL